MCPQKRSRENLKQKQIFHQQSAFLAPIVRRYGNLERRPYQYGPHIVVKIWLCRKRTRGIYHLYAYGRICRNSISNCISNIYIRLYRMQKYIVHVLNNKELLSLTVSRHVKNKRSRRAVSLCRMSSVLQQMLWRRALPSKSWLLVSSSD